MTHENLKPSLTLLPNAEDAEITIQDTITGNKVTIDVDDWLELGKRFPIISFAQRLNSERMEALTALLIERRPLNL